jgi:hypothetical protein
LYSDDTFETYSGPEEIGEQDHDLFVYYESLTPEEPK